MSQKYTIDYLELPSSDNGASAEFFKSAFGWGSIPYGPGYTGITEAGIDVGVDGQSDRVAAPLIIIRTEDLDQALVQVVGAGGVITRDPFDFPGGRRFHFREPGGAELAVWISKE